MEINYQDKVFKSKNELYEFLKENKSVLITQKRMELKKCDLVAYNTITANYQEKSINQNSEVLNVTAITNITNWLDSHRDVHVKGIWNKTLKENKNLFFLQEHYNQFDKIIADFRDIKAYVKEINLNELGINSNISAEALIFNVNIRQKRNPFMFDQYKNGYVTNHSVGMIPIKVELAINNKDYEEEYDNYNKYINEIANKNEAKELGYFWIIKEAKLIEASAVPIGSNIITPTIDVQPLESTEDKSQSSSYNMEVEYLKYIVKHFKIN